MNLRDMLDVSPEVRDAVRFGHAVVALSTTALAHSIPAPHRAAFASDTEAAVRQLRRRPHFLWYVPWSRKNSPAKTAAE